MNKSQGSDKSSTDSNKSFSENSLKPTNTIKVTVVPTGFDGSQSFQIVITYLKADN